MRRMYVEDLNNELVRLKQLEGSFLYQVKQLNKHDFALIFSRKQTLFISLNNSTPFLSLTTSLDDFPKTSVNEVFLTELRHFLGGELLSVEVQNSDVIVDFLFLRKNDNYTKEEITLRLELIANHPNAFILDSDKKIKAAFRYTSHLDQAKRIVRKNFILELPPAQNFPNQNINPISFFDEYLKTFSSTLEKANYQDITLHLNETIKRKMRLLQNFQNDYEKARETQTYYDAASQLMIEEIQVKKDEYKGLAIDPRLTNIDNANLLYKKGKKLKQGAVILTDKIKITQEEINYLQNIFHSLPFLKTELELNEVRLELGIKEGKTKQKQVIKASFPYSITINKTNYLFGKNNKQNDYLTFKIANKSDTFLHIINKPGAHVIIKKENPNKEELEIGAMIALYFSNALDGEVMVAKVKTLKKGVHLGSVISREYTTFYLRNINEKIINLLQNAKRISE